jgi:raffinose/stachyose/melibiose transport system substrate-binding protein
MHNINKTITHIGRRRAMAAMAAAVATPVALSACGSSEDGSDGGGPVEITFLNQSRGQEKALVQLAEQYSAENEISVVIDSPGPADFPAKLQSLAQSNSMPDIFSALDEGMTPYYKAGWAMDLSGELEGEWGDSLDPIAISLATVPEGNSQGLEPGTYSVHWDVDMFGLFTDPAATGIDPSAPPETLDSFFATLEGAEGSGSLLSVAASITPSLVRAYASNFMTDEAIEATARGEAPWETDAWRKAFGILEQARDAEVIASGSLPGGTDDNPNVEQSFFNVRDIGSMFNGSGSVAVARNSAPDFVDYNVIPIPAADDGDHDARMFVRVGKGAAVNAKGDHAQESLDFLKWLTEPAQQKVFAEVAGLTPTSVELLESGDGIAPQLQSLVGALGTAQVAPTPFNSDVRSAIDRGAQSLVLGEVTVDDVLADVQAAQDRSA